MVHGATAHHQDPFHDKQTTYGAIMSSHSLPLLRTTIAIAVSLALNSARADGTGTNSQVFTLGQITVTAKAEDQTSLGTSSLDSEELRDFNKDGLAEALNIIPGVTTTAGSGSRNETLISVRGFDRWQVPLLLDGIRLYLPADNRIDFDRFLTPDLSEIQVSKGYVSVLNGPDGMGGAINLVTRKPVKELEGEVRSSLAVGNNGQLNGHTSYASVGGRQALYYYQLSVEERKTNRWRVSDSFSPTLAENGGDRDHAGKQDQRINMKVGFTPRKEDEYSLNFVKQEGEKHGAGAVTGTSTISTWDWPTWDTWSAYWLSHTKLGSDSYLNTKLYYNKFTNDLVAYTNTTLSQKSWTSYYDDNAQGLSVEAGTSALAAQTLKAAFHVRRDDHTEWQVTETTGFTEPKQETVEDTFSAALEDTWHIRSDFDAVVGLSRDMRKTRKAQEYASNVLFDQPRANSQATNYQGALIYRYRTSGKLHLSISDRTRFPTMFERFSSRFGGALSNPWLKPERARNIEFGVSDMLARSWRGEAAVFYSSVDDAIQSVPIRYNGASYTQSQNVGEATYQGFELGLTGELGSKLEIGGNYSYIDTRLKNPNDATVRLTTTPQHKVFAYAKWSATEKFKLIPSIEYASPRWSSTASGSGYLQTGEYALVGVKLEYQLTPVWSVSLSGRNLLDCDYAVVDGYPQEGRNYLLSTRISF